MREIRDDEDFGISYVMWFCRHCNVMTQIPVNHVCSRGPLAGKNPTLVRAEAEGIDSVEAQVE